MLRSKIVRLIRDAVGVRSDGLMKIIKVLLDGGLRFAGPYLTSRNVIYRLDRAELNTKRAIAPPKFRVLQAPRMEDIPGAFWAALSAAQSNTSREEFALPYYEHGVLWIAFLDAVPTGYAWSVRASNLKRWYVPLEPNDIVIFSVVTFSAFRGRGFARNIIQFIALTEENDNIGFYLDTKEWNLSAQRSFEKAGFRRLTAKPPLL